MVNRCEAEQVIRGGMMQWVWLDKKKKTEQGTYPDPPKNIYEIRQQKPELLSVQTNFLSASLTEMKTDV